MRGRKLFVLLGILLCSMLAACNHGTDQAQGKVAAISKDSGTNQNASTAAQATQKATDGATGSQGKSLTNGNTDDQARHSTVQSGQTTNTTAIQTHPMTTQSTAGSVTSNATHNTNAPSTDISQANQNQASVANTPAPQQTVSLSIVGDKSLGVILPLQTVSVQDNDTVLSMLSRVLKAKHMQMEYSGFQSTAYVKGIDNLYEFDDGPKSGWMFKVNGKISDRSAGSYSIKSGDTIEWLYTVDLGKDIGAK